jgi:miniconductance mechanosensitive channel
MNVPQDLIGLSVLVGSAIAIYLISRYLVLPLLYRAVRRTAIRWDDILADHKVQSRLSWIVPLIVVRAGLRPALPDPSVAAWIGLGERLFDALLIVTGLMVISAVLNAVNTIYSKLEIAKQRPIKGWIQVLMIVLSVIGAILIIARMADQPVGFFLGGLGALSAVLILVFQTTLLSIVASVQLTQNDMLAVGDWIEMPAYGADGEVTEIALHTVKVQNWDKTIVTIPSYKLISESFVNWRGMYQARGRRIKRALLIDETTARFMTDDEIERFARFAPLAEYMDRKRAEIDEWNRENDPGAEMVGDPRRLTNLGTFRAYVIAYLDRHPGLATDRHTFLVRHLPPGPTGLPIELYVFTETTDWNEYESIQADIFDHLLAMIPEFGLRVFQEPTGSDIASLGSR